MRGQQQQLRAQPALKFIRILAFVAAYAKMSLEALPRQRGGGNGCVHCCITEHLAAEELL